MRIHVGCEMTCEIAQVTPMILKLSVRTSHVSNLERPDYLVTTPSVPVEGRRDAFGNWCNRVIVPTGRLTVKTDAVVLDRTNKKWLIRAPRRSKFTFGPSTLADFRVTTEEASDHGFYANAVTLKWQCCASRFRESFYAVMRP